MPTEGRSPLASREPTARRDWSKRRDRSRLWDKRTLFVFDPFPRSLSILLLPCPPFLSPSARPASLELPHHPRVRLRPSPPARAARPPSRSRRHPPRLAASPQLTPPVAVAAGCPGISPGARVPATSDMNSAYAASISVPALAVLPRFRLRWPPAPRPDLRASRLCRRLRGNVPRVPASTRARTSFGRLYLSSFPSATIVAAVRSPDAHPASRRIVVPFNAASSLSCRLLCGFLSGSTGVSSGCTRCAARSTFSTVSAVMCTWSSSSAVSSSAAVARGRAPARSEPRPRMETRAPVSSLESLLGSTAGADDQTDERVPGVPRGDVHAQLARGRAVVSRGFVRGIERAEFVRDVAPLGVPSVPTSLFSRESTRRPVARSYSGGGEGDRSWGGGRGTGTVDSMRAVSCSTRVRMASARPRRAAGWSHGKGAPPGADSRGARRGRWRAREGLGARGIDRDERAVDPRRWGGAGGSVGRCREGARFSGARIRSDTEGGGGFAAGRREPRCRSPRHLLRRRARLGGDYGGDVAHGRRRPRPARLTRTPSPSC